MTAPPDGELAAGAGGVESPVEHTAADRLPGLDGLRGLAALAVVGTHVGYATGRYYDGTVGALLARLDVGVAVFFVLSGFLLCRPWYRSAARDQAPPRAAAYLWRRALRILPAYWLAVTGAFLLLPDNADVGPADWVRHLLLVQVYWPDWNRAGLSQMWSLSAEVAFYAVLPALMAGALRLQRGSAWRLGRATVVPAVMVVVSLGAPWLIHSDDPALPAQAQTWLLAHAGWFAAGMVLAAVTVHIELEAQVPRPRRRPVPAVDLLVRVASQPGACWAAAAALLWFSATPLAGPVALEPTTPQAALVKELVYLVVAGLLLLPLALAPRHGTLTAMLDSPPLRRLGDLSYGIFLYHLALLDGAMALLDQPEFTGSFVRTMLLTTVAAWVLAAASRRFVERPAMRLRRLVPEGQRRPLPRPAGTAP